MKSLKASLARFGKTPPLRVPGSLQITPKSLKEMLWILNLPRPNLETLQKRRVYDFDEENSQGVVYAYDRIWFLVDQNSIRKFNIEGADLYHPTKIQSVLGVEASDLERQINLRDFTHFGDASYSRNLLFVPVQQKSQRPLLLALANSLEVVAYARFTAGTKDAWCAVNPWNQMLYASKEPQESTLLAYDPAAFYTVLPHREQWGREVALPRKPDRDIQLYARNGTTRDDVSGIQGAAFSSNGRLYVTWWWSRSEAFNETVDFSNHLRVYDLITGTLFDDREIDFSGTFDEIEGLTVHPSGVIYVAVCDNDVLSSDQFQLYAFQYQDSTFPV